MGVITVFDPWNDPLCTCPPKYTCSPYISCGHGCLYCYITSYIPGGFHPRPKKNFIHRLLHSLRKVNPDKPISIANSSDPYTPPEAKLGLTRKALNILIPRGYKILILTKSSLVVRDLDIIRKGNVAVSITITTPNQRVAKKLEPGAPDPLERVKIIKILSRNGIPCIARIDPLLPGINSDEGEIRKLVKLVVNAGAMHIVASTYKARPDSLIRLKRAFPKLAEEYNRMYRDHGIKVKRMVWYLRRNLREELLKMVRDIVLEEGITFATCREGIPYLNYAPTCDGTHLIPKRRKIAGVYET